MGCGYADFKALQPWLENRSTIAGVAVLYHEQTSIDLPDYPYAEAEVKKQGIVEADLNKPDNTYRKLVGAAVGLATQAQVPVDVIIEDDLDVGRLSRYQSLIITAAARLSEGQAEVINRYVRDGGTLVLSCDTALRKADGGLRSDFLLADAMGVSFDGVDERFVNNQWGSYLARAAHPVWRGLPETDLPLPGPRYRVRLKGAEVLAYHVDPCAAVEVGRWVSWWSPPPGRATTEPLVTLHEHGAGKVIYFGANPFDETLVWIKAAFVNMLKWLMGRPCICVHTDCPGVLGSSFWRKDKTSEVVVHLVNLGVEHLAGEVLAIRGAGIEVDGEFASVKRAHLVTPQEQPLKVLSDGAVQTVSMPDIEVHSVVVLETD